MLKLLEKYVHLISILLLVILLVTLLFYPATTQKLAILVLVFGLGSAILFTIHSNWGTKQNDEPFGSAQDRLTNAQFARNTAIDLLGLALTMGVAMWLGALAALSVNSAGAGQVWGLLAGMVVSFGAALVVGKVWGRAADRLRATNA
jgi:hypothetical protein